MLERKQLVRSGINTCIKLERSALCSTTMFHYRQCSQFMCLAVNLSKSGLDLLFFVLRATTYSCLEFSLDFRLWY